MLSFSELSNKINVSIGLIISLIITTSAVTMVYMNFNTIENRMDKRYSRHEDHFSIIEEQQDKNFKYLLNKVEALEDWKSDAIKENYDFKFEIIERETKLKEEITNLKHQTDLIELKIKK